MFHSKKWICGYPDKGKIKELTETMGISPILAATLVNRGFDSKEDAEGFLYPKLDQLADPFLMPDMEVSVERIIGALNRREKICIYGDYDVDGITSVSVMMRVLRAAGADVFFYIPSRMDEGYGLNKQAIEEIHTMEARLIITVDCGITSFEEIELCNRLDIDTIVTDHHQCQKELPPALGIINPKRIDSVYPYKEFAGVGVAYKLCAALCQAGSSLNINMSMVDDMLDLVALGTVADIVPLTGENRVLVNAGLKQMANTINPGLKALMQVAGVKDDQISAGQVAFRLAPRINASGRLSVAEKGVQLLLAESVETALMLAKEMDEQNRERQALEREIFEQSVKMAETRVDDSILVLASDHWHPGVIGIAASKIADRYNKPAILFSIDGQEARGSARSIPGLDLHELLSKCGQYYKSFGGHKQAAGLTLDTNRLKNFAREINLIVCEAMKGMDGKYIIKADGDLTGMGISVEHATELKLLEPCGCGNPSPLFIKRQVRVWEPKRIGKQREHIKLAVDEGNSKYGCIAFRWQQPDWPVKGQRLDILFSPQVNLWLGNQDLQLVLKDMKSLSIQRPFLQNWYNSIMDLDAHGELAQGIEVSLPGGIDILRTNNRYELLADLFNKCTGNLLIVNGYREVVDMASMLCMYPKAEVCFGCLESYSADSNYIVVHPYTFNGIESSSGKLYLLGHSVLPKQLQAIGKLENIKPIMIIDEDVCCLSTELHRILPNRKVLAEIYLLIKGEGSMEFDTWLGQMIQRGINPATAVLAMEGLREMDLIGIQESRLSILPTPESKVKIQQARPFEIIKAMAAAAEICYNTVKKHSFDI